MKTKFDSKNLIDKYSDMIYRIALGYLRNKEDAEDVVQDVFLKYIKHIKSNRYFNNEIHEKCWLIRVTINVCHNKLKHIKNQRNVILENNFYFEFDEEEYAILESIDKLEEKYKIVFELFYIRDFKISEISKILNISEASVKTRLKRAREKLRKNLQLGAGDSSERF